MKHILKCYTSGLLALLSGVAVAQEEKEHAFAVSAQIRPRFEYRNGAYKPIQKHEAPAILTHNRLRLNLDYQQNDQLSLHLSLQNVSIWGQAKQIQVADPQGGMSVFQAFAKVKLWQGISAKVGRQMIALDDDRLFGSLDWHPAGRAHDGLGFHYTPNANTHIQSFFAWNQNYDNVNRPSGQHFEKGQDYQHMQLIHANTKINEQANASFVFANLGYRKGDANAHNLQTLGTHWIFTPSTKASLSLSGYYQMGKNEQGIATSAFLLAFSTQYKANEGLSLGLGADYLSGTQPNSKKNHSFVPFSGTNHKFYGFMDYYYVASRPNGLLDIYASVKAKTNAYSNLSATLHSFTAPVKIDNKSNLGQELDLVYSYQKAKFVGLQVGYSVYMKTDIMGGNNARAYQDWLWVQLNINPKIFSTKF